MRRRRGIIYVYLARMEDEGLVSSRPEDDAVVLAREERWREAGLVLAPGETRRRLYRITAAGRARL